MEIKYKTSPIGNIYISIQELMKDYRFPISSTIDALGEYLEHLRDDIYICVEFPYVDRTFRDSYYSYFSTKRRLHTRECIRISLFNNVISDGDFFNDDSLNDIQKEGNFLGYLVIRPTEPNVIAKTVISPNALKRKDFDCCLANYKITLNGIGLEVSGFPHQSQDEETMKCAEVAIWSTMEYFGNKYSDYKPILPSDIVNILKKYSYERQLPSAGLPITQISYVLKKMGFGVRIYSKSVYKDDVFEEIINSYVESQIPIIAHLKLGKSGHHAYLIIGRKVISEYKINKILPSKTVQTLNGNVNIINSFNMCENYVVIDDTFPPYQLTTINDPASYYYKKLNNEKKFVDTIPFGKEKQQKVNEVYSVAQIENIVVPLYKKIYLDAYSARQLILNIFFPANEIGYSYNENEIILQLFLT